MAVTFFKSGRKLRCAAGVFRKTFHVKRFLVQEKKSRMALPVRPPDRSAGTPDPFRILSLNFLALLGRGRR